MNFLQLQQIPDALAANFPLLLLAVENFQLGRRLLRRLTLDDAACWWQQLDNVQPIVRLRRGKFNVLNSSKLQSLQGAVSLPSTETSSSWRFRTRYDACNPSNNGES